MIKEELILQYLQNELSVSDEKEVMEWAEKNPLDFQFMEEIWEVSSEVKNIKLFDVDNEWASFMNGIYEEENSEVTTPVIPISKQVEERRFLLWSEWKPVAMAASFLFLVIVSYFLWPRNVEIIHLAMEDNSPIELSDGTDVKINKGSTLKYPKIFAETGKRIVKLEGIATFDITPDPNRPFIVKTSNSGVKALGTIFEVDASSIDKTGVVNIEGLIRFFDLEEENTFVDVKEGESFVFDGNGFSETTPEKTIPPTIKRFKAPPVVQPTVREVINYLYTISNGHAVPKGNNFDWDKKVDVSLKTTNVKKLIYKIQMKSSMSVLKKDCNDCYEIISLRIR